MKLRLFLAIMAAAFMLSCETDPTSTKKKKKVSLQGAFVLNEGNFLQSNASLSFYDFEQQTMQNNIFNTANGSGPGDVLQSMTIIDTLGFLVLNNSHKIEVIGLNSWKRVFTINLDGKGPRCVADGDNGNIYVTNMNTGNVSVIDLDTYTEQAAIAVGAQPDEILIFDDMAYIANSGWGYDNTVSVIDIKQNQLVKTINVADNPGFLTVDNNDNINVLCTGRWPAWGDTTDTGTNGGLYVISSKNQTVVDSIVITGHPGELSYDGDETGYFINGAKIVSYSTETYELISDTTFSGFYYSVEVDPVSGYVYALDAKDYQQSGDLKIFQPDGTLLETHAAGIIPGAVTFIYNN